MLICDVTYNPKTEITSMCKVTQTRIGEKDIKFNLRIAEDIPYELIGDKIKVKGIINNLLTNSIKYTDSGEINLKINCINDTEKNISTLIITCQDTGRGIKTSDINKLFTKCERLDIEKNSTTEGTGLGLAITKSLTEMMGGKINVQSQFGKGSIFVVHLPQKISKLTKDISDKELSNTLDSYLNRNNLINYSNKRILVVDDNKLNIKVVKRALSSFNMIIDECYDGEACINKVNDSNNYDLILMDIMMPNMSGETALRKLKENSSFKTPVIALTADSVSGAKEKYLSEGFIDYISKPFSRDQIKEKLDIIFKNSSFSEDNQNTLKYNPNIDRFKGTEAYVFGESSNSRDDEII